MSYVSNPRWTLNLVPRDQRLGLDDRRVLIVGQKLSGSAVAGLNRDMPRTNAEINALFGARSHVAMMARNFRKVNPVTNVDVIALADNGSGVAGTGVIAFSGTATEAKTIYVTVGSGTDHRYEVDIAVGDTAAAVATKVEALADADTTAPFTAGVATGTITFTAANKGTLCNTWLISLLDSLDRPAAVAGLTYTITAWADGATNPSLTGVFDEVASIRYQDVLWPEAYALSTLKAFIDPRKNVDNTILDGTGYTWSSLALADLKAAAIANNSSECLVLSNEANALSYWKGPHIPEFPDAVTAKMVAAISRRFEDDFSISDIVVTNEPRDQFGGIHTASLPYFNTPLLFSRQPLNGTGYTDVEQVELRDSGVTVIGYNRMNNAVILGEAVTTWINDAAGNEDDTWKYLEWRHTHGAIREYIVKNCRREFSQYRLSLGAAVPGLAIATEGIIRAFLYQLYDELADYGLTLKGRAHRKYFEDNLTVNLVPANRRAEIAADVPMMSQFAEGRGSIKFSFPVGQAS